MLINNIVRVAHIHCKNSFSRAADIAPYKYGKKFEVLFILPEHMNPEYDIFN